MIAGFSGPRSGMTKAQWDTLLERLHALGATQLHHGDCVGADEQAHMIGRSLGLWIVGHPPKVSGLRAFCRFDEEREPAEFLTRNNDIVRESQILMATPNCPERMRSGTWTTIRYARRLHRRYLVIAPDGKAVERAT